MYKYRHQQSHCCHTEPEIYSQWQKQCLKSPSVWRLLCKIFCNGWGLETETCNSEETMGAFVFVLFFPTRTWVASISPILHHGLLCGLCEDWSVACKSADVLLQEPCTRPPRRIGIPSTDYVHLQRVDAPPLTFLYHRRQTWLSVKHEKRRHRLDWPIVHSGQTNSLRNSDRVIGLVVTVVVVC